MRDLVLDYSGCTVEEFVRFLEELDAASGRLDFHAVPTAAAAAWPMTIGDIQSDDPAAWPELAEDWTSATD